MKNMNGAEELELLEEKAERTEKTEEEKKRSMDSLIEKGKKGKLSADDLDEAMEEMDFDVDSIAVPGGVQFMLEHRERSAHFLSVAKRVLSELEFDVYRYWMLGYKTSEIASALGASAKTVDNAKNRMWKKLRSHLTPED
jgi:DNA-binding CsgD family transcriptional regulator